MNKQEAFSYYASQLEDIRNSGVLKAERIITTPQSAHIFADGKELLNMCANNYLGLADNRELAEETQRVVTIRDGQVVDVRPGSGVLPPDSLYREGRRNPLPHPDTQSLQAGGIVS